MLVLGSIPVEQEMGRWNGIGDGISEEVVAQMLASSKTLLFIHVLIKLNSYFVEGLFYFHNDRTNSTHFIIVKHLLYTATTILWLLNNVFVFIMQSLSNVVYLRIH